MTWLKVSAKLKNQDLNMAEMIGTHFQIDQNIVEDFVRNTGNMIADNIEVALGRCNSSAKFQTTIDPNGCSTGGCTTIDMCRMQWGSRNISRIIFGDDTFFGLQEINFSLPIPFEFTDKPDLFLTYQETRELLAVNYQGAQHSQPNSIINFTNIGFLLQNLNETNLLASRFVLSEPKAAQLAAWVKRVLNSLNVIDPDNPEISYFRGTFSLK